MQRSFNMAIYTQQDHTAIRSQIYRRLLLLLIPVALLIALMVYSLVVRAQTLTIIVTILIGVICIAGYDLAIKPLWQYEKFISTALHGRSRQCELPFVSLSEDVNLVDGVPCRALSAEDIDGKGRPYDRLFYFDAQKAFPDVKAGDMLRITHHDLNVVNLEVL